MEDVSPRPPHQNGSLCIEAGVSPALSNTSSPLPFPIPAENWRVAEQATQQIIWRIQPTKVSEERRKEVVEYVQQLLRYYLGEVFPFGSVPLKTYLPDGDIDLTALGLPYDEENLAAKVRTILKEEEDNMDAKFEVKDIQYIHAEVKLVKCLVQNIVVDISFNQIGGLSTLCFLEQVDNLIGKDHLFKRSIILIKAWCYYESRILGAHHSLLSTYALETLVLYIFHLFNSSLHGPLAVLYRFFDYFSRFDWDKFAVSLSGPVRLSSLPEIIVEETEINGGDLLLSGQFLNRCRQMFSVPPRVSELHKPFCRKHLNIVDPLKDNNNLGRGVSKGILYRIRSAFIFGAKKLQGILLLSRDGIVDELRNFFKNTLERREDGERLDVQEVGSCSVDQKASNFGCTDRSLSLESSLQKDLTDNKINMSDLDDCQRRLCDEISSIDILSSEKASVHSKASGDCPEATCSKRDVEKPIADVKPGSMIPKEHSEELPLTARGSACFAPHQFFSQKNKHTTCPRRVESSVDSCNETESNNDNSHGEDLVSVISDIADLSGSLEMHQKNLVYAQSYAEGFPNGSFTQIHNKQHWEAAHQYEMAYMNGIPQIPSYSPRGHYQMYPGYYIGSYGIMNMNMLKPRGTGTFLPNTSHIEYKERLSTPGGVRKSCNDSPTVTPMESCSADGADNELLDQLQIPVSGEKDHARPSSSGTSQSSVLLTKGFSQVNGSMPPDSRLEFGSLQPNLQADSQHLDIYLDSTAPHDQTNGPAACSPLQRSRMRSNHQRMAHAFHLKNEDEFPPLSSRGGANGSVTSDGNTSRAVWEAKK